MDRAAQTERFDRFREDAVNLLTNARVRSPGSRPSVIDAAAARRTSRSGDMRRDRPSSSDSVSPPASRVIAAVSSENRRTHALVDVSALSERTRSSGSLSRCGR